MSDEIRRVDPAKLSTTLKEAVVDSLLNMTFSRISGHGPDGEVLFGARPRTLLNSAFLLPHPLTKGAADEVTDPIQISAHGLDFQVAKNADGTVSVQPNLRLYVRVLPDASDIKRPDCLLNFRLNDETKKSAQSAVKEALRIRWEEEATKGHTRRYEHPEWKAIEAGIRKMVLGEMGLPEDLRTLFSVEAAQSDDSAVGADGAEDDGAAEGVVLKEGASLALNDAHFKPLDVPHKWLRIPLIESLPKFEFCPNDALATIQEKTSAASVELNASLARCLRAWADSEPGKLWCYRRGAKVHPSQYLNWEKYLEHVRSKYPEQALPRIELAWATKVSPDWLDPGRSNVHLSLENRSEGPKSAYDETDESVFQVHLDVTVGDGLHKRLKLGRVKPSYRYNRYLEYPAMGFNGGVQEPDNDQCTGPVLLRTTWAPRYVQPRILPKSYPRVDPNIRRLSEPDGLSGLLRLGEELEQWFAGLDGAVDLEVGLDRNDAEGLLNERRGFAEDKKQWRAEIDAVKAGFDILQASKQRWDTSKQRGQQQDEGAIVYEAWLAMNETMANLMRQKVKDDSGAWRLFQIAFIVANIPTMASRTVAFKKHFEKERDDTVTLLYFATGGGKSEAFFGLLVFTLFFDRLRGKRTGVTAMLRYPLRLLTIQQAQRCSRVLAHAELLRRKYEVGGDAFSIGFWVGSGGSPNHHSDPGLDYIPDIKKVDASQESEAHLETTDANYRVQKQAWNKIPKCPFCGTSTALRLFAAAGGTLGHVCTKLTCESNDTGWTPLPFYICDTDIYDFAPSVLLGTVDKLALIGQSSRTLRRIYGMFGAAPWRHRETGRLFMPTEPIGFEGGPEAKGYEKLFPAYDDGVKRFFDPFPSLLIQDEAHLLDESLGTFAGLFESTLDAVFTEMAKPLHQLVAYEPDGQTRRRAKVIAASATVSEPQRQLEHLYQRPVPAMQFPYPGQSLYESFYAAPSAPPIEDGPARSALDSVEERGRWSRVYAAFMTNGRPHTATTVSVLSNFHTVVSQLLLDLTSADQVRMGAAKEQLLANLSPTRLRALYADRVGDAEPAALATLVDLHRIALTYVTNKKGGDQIMAAEFEETRKRHAERGLPITDLRTKLITGSVSQGEIQATVEEAQDRPPPGMPFPPLAEALRSVIATSAISHGVDVEELNAMFFAGMPSDIAEYIQASSRVGRMHVGFVVLIPTPQRRRDRYIVEVFDSFHRFLERMVQPAAIDRWAGKAIERVLPSLIQAYLAGVLYVKDMTLAAPEGKNRVPDYSWIPTVTSKYSKEATKKPLVDGMCAFIENAIGLDNDEFAPGGREHYQRVIRDKVHDLLGRWAGDRLQAAESLQTYFKAQRSVMDRPMTSLRDVDEAGDIHFGGRDLNGKYLDGATAKRVMAFIRNGVAESAEAGEKL